MENNDDQDDDYLIEDTPPRGERTAGEVLTRVEMDLAYSSEKVLILEILLMRVSGNANDHESLTMENEGISSESLVNAFELDLLSGILISEVKVLENFMTSLKNEIADARQKFCQSDISDEFSAQTESRLRVAEESLKQSQGLVTDLRMQAENFERTLASGDHNTRNEIDEETVNDHLSSSSMWKLQTVEQQRDILQMLEKSLARELDLEKKLSDSKDNEEELKMKLHYAEQEAYCLEESIETIMEKMFEAENAAALLVGISKELAGKVQIVQSHLNDALQRECQMNSELQEGLMKLSSEQSTLEKLKTSQVEIDKHRVLQENSLKDNLKDAEDRYVLANSEASTLRGKVTSLEEKLRESESQLELAKTSVEASQEQQNFLHSELDELKNVIQDLRENVLGAESRATSAEAKCELLTKTNTELNQELGSLRNSGTDKANTLERKLRESDTQLEHAKASVEAIEEQQNMLYAALRDMENLIEDLKGKVSKAESRAESAESKFTLLTETNLELNEEVGFLRGKLVRLETSLHQTDDAKVAAAKDIGIRTKIVTDLVTKLISERERLQLQICTLATNNKVLSEKYLKTKDSVLGAVNLKGTKTENESNIFKSTEAVFSTTSFQVEKSAAVTSTCETVNGDVASNLETVRTIDATQLKSKYFFIAIVVVLVSAAAAFLFQLESY